MNKPRAMNAVMNTRFFQLVLFFVLLGAGWGAAPKPVAPDPTFTKQQVQAFIEVQAALAGGDPKVWKADLEGVISAYPVPGKELKAFVASETNADTRAKKKAKPGLQPVKMLVRSKYSDVLTTEDPTVQASDSPPAKADNEKGANFSFTHNFQSKNDKWQVTGAAILPIVFKSETEPNRDNWVLESWGFIPSVSLNEVKDGDKPSSDVDSLIYRVGVFGQLYEPNLSGFGERGTAFHQFRGFFTYGTDLHHKSAIPTGEFEWEPQLDLTNKIGLGVRKTLIWRPEADKKHVSIADDALLAYQFRVYLHGEFGDITKAGDKAIPEQSFSHLGPAVELSLDPFFLKDLSLTVSYRYYSTLSGYGDVPYLFDSSLAWTLWKDPSEKSHKVTLKLGYTDGGQDLTQLREKLTTIGLGITF